MMHRWRRSWYAFAVAALCTAPVAAQDKPADGAKAESRERLAPLQDATERLVLPKSGRLVDGKGQLVIVADEQGQPVVAKLHCQVGDVSLAVLPTGKMKSVPTAQVTVTQRPFKAVDPAALLTSLKTGRFESFKAEVSDHYAYLYRCDEHLYQTTRNILESLYDGVVESLAAWKIPHHAAEVPLVVLIFPDRASFDAYHTMPADVLAYYDGMTNFIVLYQDPELSDAAPELALKQAAYTIAHEGVHQLLNNFGVQQRLAPWPAWICEGLPEMFCPMKVSSKMVKQGGSTMPQRNVNWTKVGMVNDLRMYGLLKARTTGGEAMKQVVAGEALTAQGYGVAWGLTHYLANKRKANFRKFLHDVAAIEPLSGFPARRGYSNNELFIKHFGSDFAALEKEVAAYLNSKPMQEMYRDPLVYQTHYVVIHNAVRGKDALVTVMISLSPEDARKWKQSEEQKFENATGPVKHGFRTEVCETRQKAEATVARIGGKR